MKDDKTIEDSVSLRHWQPPAAETGDIRQQAIIDCGWGRLIFAQTFPDSQVLTKTLAAEQPGKRDIAFYVRNPQVVISLAPQKLFIDPSITYRLWLDRPFVKTEFVGIRVTDVTNTRQAKALHDCYLRHKMVPPDPEFVTGQQNSLVLCHLVATDVVTGDVVGGVTGVDHREGFNDPENGSSLWALVVDPQCKIPGVGEALVRILADRFRTRGRSFMDLSVLHDNRQAIALYEKLGFERVPVFAVKNKNSINETLYIGEAPEDDLNPYAGIIVREARRRGIAVEVLDADNGFFQLSFGGRSLVCRESLSELTTAIALTRCDDKRLTHRILAGAGLRMPAQTRVKKAQQARDFLQEFNRVVVKPKRGEQGAGISVDVRDADALEKAIDTARTVCEDVLVEEFVEGEDLRIVVIGDQVVAAALRRPPTVVGTGRHRVRDLITKLSRRRQAATSGESHIPLDAETERCVGEAGFTMDSVLPEGLSLQVRKTANLHTGGTIHDVTAELSPALAEVAIRAARALDIPVVGLDLMVESVQGDQYRIIEANERPGLANHEPQPTAERFVDLLFPQTQTSQN